MQRFAVLVALLLCPCVAGAGAWPREKGRTFLSFGATVSVPYDDPGAPPRTYVSLYSETGLGRGLTFGIDAGMDPDQDSTAILFLRKSFGPEDRRHLLAVQAGIGATTDGAATDYLLQLGGAWGRGLETRFGRGWIALDAQALYWAEQGEVAVKADLTLGLKPVERTKLMLQVQSGQYPGSDPYVRLVPSVARKIGRRTHLEIGAEFGVTGDDRFGLKLGTWLEF